MLNTIRLQRQFYDWNEYCSDNGYPKYIYSPSPANDGIGQT